MSERMTDWKLDQMRVFVELLPYPGCVVVEDLLAEIDRLRAGLPKTADGVVVTLDENGEWPLVWLIAHSGAILAHTPWAFDDICDMYSTEEAAKAAAKAAR